MRAETTALLERLDHGDITPDTYVRTLRPAAQQVVSIARALSRNVRLLIMDEPSAILDDGEVEVLFGVVRRLAADGVGVIYISHRLDEIRRIGDRVTVLVDGATVATGLPADTPRRRARGEAWSAAGSSSCSRTRRGPRRTTSCSTVRGVSRAPDVHECSFEVRAGEVVGIGGLVGAGRTRAAAADLRPRSARRAARCASTASACPPGRPRRGDRRAAWGSRPRTASPRACCSAGAWRRTSASPTSGSSSAGR